MEVYFLAASLDPSQATYFSALADSLAGTEPGHGGEQADRAYSLWEVAADAYPNYVGNPEFLLAGSLLAQAAGRYNPPGTADPGGFEAEALVVAAIVDIEAGDMAAAVACARRAAELAPQRPDVLCLLAYPGMLNPVPADVVAIGPLPRRPDTDDALQAGGAQSLSRAGMLGTGRSCASAFPPGTCRSRGR